MANIISTGKKLSKQQQLARRRLWVVGAVIGVVVVALLAYGVWQLVQRSSPDTREADKQTMNDLSVTAYDLNKKGDYDAAAKVYADAANQAPTPKKKQEILLQQASMAFEQNKLDDALRAAKDAEQAQPGLAVSQMIAIIAEKKGDKEMAVSYLKTALGQLDTNAPMYEFDAKEMKDKITALGGSL